MDWLFLVAAIACEVIATTCLKLSLGFTRVVPTVIMAVGYILSFVFLALVVRTIHTGVAYAIWSGAGTMAIAVVAMLWLREPLTVSKAACILLIVTGVVGLWLQDSGESLLRRN